MKIVSMSLGMVSANCYLIFSGQNRAAVIDPGGEAEKIIARLEKEGATPAFVLLTHGHFDHIAGLWDLLERYPMPVYVHAKDLERLEHIELSLGGLTPLYFHYVPGADLRAVQEGDTISLDEITFSVLHTPGHTKGSVCYRMGDVLFTGDTLFAGSVGRTDLYGGDWEDLRHSAARLAEIPENLRVCPGHGLSSSLAREQRSNPYLKEFAK